MDVAIDNDKKRTKVRKPRINGLDMIPMALGLLVLGALLLGAFYTLRLSLGRKQSAA